LELEEEFFYPAFLAATCEIPRHHDSMVEHEVVKKLIADIENSDTRDEFYRSMVRILWKTIKGHMAEEESAGGVLASASTTTMDLSTLGLQIASRREELLEQMMAREREGF